MKAILPKRVMFAEKAMTCRSGSEIWNAIVGITLIEIAIVQSILCQISLSFKPVLIASGPITPEVVDS